ncbi:MAG TPA: cytochrome c maturation protein CcmE [Thermoanaerobaculia bacterium]
MRSRWAVVIALVVAAGAFAFIAAGRIGNNLVYYWSPSDLLHAGDKAYGASIRLGGLVAQGSLAAQKTSADVQFDVTDLQSTVHVKTHGVPPQMFREGIGVVVEGTMTRDGYFDGSRLMVSHNNEYRAPKNHGKVNAEELIRSTKGSLEVTQRENIHRTTRTIRAGREGRARGRVVGDDCCAGKRTRQV